MFHGSLWGARRTVPCRNTWRSVSLISTTSSGLEFGESPSFARWRVAEVYGEVCLAPRLLV